MSGKGHLLVDASHLTLAIPTAMRRPPRVRRLNSKQLAVQVRRASSRGQAETFVAFYVPQSFGVLFSLGG